MLQKQNQSLLLPQPLARTSAPHACQVTVTRQAEQGRRVIHLFSYLPRQVAEAGPTVDEVLPLHDLELSVRCDDGSPEKVQLQPQGKDLPFTWRPPYATFTVPTLKGHQLIEVA